ncbi:LON peptidase substrate-binding domain-containing protein [Magnetospirillum moscoviense]|uniref:ATP-dependent protease n=1 Tax=Magnetospirillum moscoviense TaxID=1437059 RepID=A0A178MHJ1_9PROT|nr:LON peptidase substrate-binding domain-containing protein [Magnetospirillum moscoviense]OAN47637.1 ATP-dependent protease [Magnetospirillum moscoviense]
MAAPRLTIADLPAVVPVFAVPGALLLPGARLPLTVFEPRYLAMVDDCLGAGRLFALVQPAPNPHAEGAVAGLYGTGIVARIVAFGETGDGRYLITALGLWRFRLAGEELGRSGYRRVAADYTPYRFDLEGEAPQAIDRRRLMSGVSTYLARQGAAPDQSKLDEASDGELVTALAMSAPLSPEEKQAILEAMSTSERARLMMTLFEMALLADTGQDVRH